MGATGIVSSTSVQHQHRNSKHHHHVYAQSPVLKHKFSRHSVDHQCPGSNVVLRNRGTGTGGGGQLVKRQRSVKCLSIPVTSSTARRILMQQVKYPKPYYINLPASNIEKNKAI